MSPLRITTDAQNRGSAVYPAAPGNSPASNCSTAVAVQSFAQWDAENDALITSAHQRWRLEEQGHLDTPVRIPTFSEDFCRRSRLPGYFASDLRCLRVQSSAPHRWGTGQSIAWQEISHARADLDVARRERDRAARKEKLLEQRKMWEQQRKLPDREIRAMAVMEESYRREVRILAAQMNQAEREQDEREMQQQCAPEVDALIERWTREEEEREMKQRVHGEGGWEADDERVGNRKRRVGGRR